MSISLAPPTQSGGSTTITLGYDWSRSTSRGENYTNAQLSAGGDLTISTGRDAGFMGANVNGRNIYMDVGRDLSVVSLQNWSVSSNRAFNVSVSFTVGANGVPVPTGFGLGGGVGEGRRTYTDTPTTIIAGREIKNAAGVVTGVVRAVFLHPF
jgi:hypothetical protein